MTGQRDTNSAIGDRTPAHVTSGKQSSEEAARALLACIASGDRCAIEGLYVLYFSRLANSFCICMCMHPNFESGDMYQGKSEEYVAAGTSYLAYSGPYFVDEASRMVEHEMFVSLFPNWKGQRQVRIVKLDDKELHLSPNVR